ncbi:MAG: hypothetical protein JXA67_20940 [Micromonosporaceae bacterium]|nr:hypothetical protein [Micromonosporaceae bacterium]
MSTLISYLTSELRYRWRLLRERPDAGYSTEAVLVTALLVTLALLVIGTIAAKVSGKANSIDLG